VLLVAAPVLLAGCASHSSSTAASPASGMSMPSGAAAAAAAPPETAAMVCGAEIKGKVKQVLDLPADPSTRSTWANSTYTCSYALPMGPMTLTVQVLPNSARAAAKLDAGKAAAAGAQTLAGLGERAWSTPAGTAVVLKDNQILTVDATGLPAVFGANDQKRSDLAYEVASDVLGCWTGDGS
jgi:hypothetical protein